ncbi:MAG: biopolymer transporter ExbD [Planctomycetaceae bacterium]
MNWLRAANPSARSLDSRMPLKLESIEEPSLNLTPMIDVVLLLVIFFMVGTQFAEEESQYEIDLPTARTAQPLTGGPDEIVVNIYRDGRLIVSEREVSVDELETLLRSARERYAKQAVTVRGDGSGPYQHVMTVLDLCRRTGIVNVQLANRIDEGASS